MSEPAHRDTRVEQSVIRWLEDFLADSGRSPEALTQDLLHRCKHLPGVKGAGLVRSQMGSWVPVLSAGTVGTLPERLLAQAAETGRAMASAPWVVVPVGSAESPPELLVLETSDKSPEMLPERASELASVLKLLWETANRWNRLQVQLARRERILASAQRWIGIRDCDRLFEDIATTATEILECERATIFLWNRRRRLLVGRPALGVPGGQLVIPDDRGVVGRVIRTGKPARADLVSSPSAIDHSVDEQLGFVTRSVLCVPLRGKDGLQGAFEVLNKHSGRFSDEDEEMLAEIAAFAAAALENAQEHQTLAASHAQMLSEVAGEVELVGVSPAIATIRSLIGRIADTDLTVLILGENGTGKEVVARLIHFQSWRRRHPFLAVNCAAIPESLAESELFGHERGAFTDAVQARPGKFELAGRGTLLLDEVGELTPACQAKLLRVLEERTFVRVGGTVPISCEARIIAATNQDLNELVRQRRFREDLFYRLNGLTIELPPLRARKEDIPLLARHFLQKFCLRARRPVPELTAAAEALLCEYPWPGNVRELRNTMERIAYLTTGDIVDVDDLRFLFALGPKPSLPKEIAPSRIIGGISSTSLAEATREFQRELVRTVLAETQGNLTEAARRLGLHRSNLYRKLRQLGLGLPNVKDAKAGGENQ